MDMAAVTTEISAFDASDAMTAIITVVVSIWAFRTVRGLLGGK
jgi:hypothetical protein